MSNPVHVDTLPFFENMDARCPRCDSGGDIWLVFCRETSGAREMGERGVCAIGDRIPKPVHVDTLPRLPELGARGILDDM